MVAPDMALAVEQYAGKVASAIVPVPAFTVSHDGNRKQAEDRTALSPLCVPAAGAYCCDGGGGGGGPS